MGKVDGPDVHPVETFPVEVRGEEVFVGLPE